MKKYTTPFLLYFISFLIVNKGIAQSFPSNEDSARILLCKNWELDYMLMTGVKIMKDKNTPGIFFKFKNDSSFIETSSDHSNKITGRWIIDMEHRVVRLMQKEKNTMAVQSLTPVELQLRVYSPSNGDTDEMTMVLKPAGK